MRALVSRDCSSLNRVSFVFKSIKKHLWAHTRKALQESTIGEDLAATTRNTLSVLGEKEIIKLKKVKLQTEGK